MRTSLRLCSVLLASSLALTACGSSVPPPTEKLASAEAASRSARELGASNDPKAALHLKLAEEQIDQGKKLMTDGDNKRADLVLQRANADAELSVMFAKESTATAEASKAKDHVAAMKAGK